MGVRRRGLARRRMLTQGRRDRPAPNPPGECLRERWRGRRERRETPVDWPHLLAAGPGLHVRCPGGTGRDAGREPRWEHRPPNETALASHYRIERHFLPPPRL